MSIKFVLKRNSQSSQTANNQIIAEYSFDGNLFTIGNDPGNNLVLEEGAFEQAVIVREGEQMTLINSADGTRLNDAILTREAIQPLNIGDQIGIGSYMILVADATQTAKVETLDVFTTSEDEVTDIYATTQDVPLDIYATTKFNLSEIAEAKPEKVSKNPTTIQPVPPRNIEPPASNAPELQDQSAPQRNFAEILDTLRTEDDSFYFTVKTAEQDIKRIALDQTETPIGIAPKGEIVTVVEDMSNLCAIARKDWSGILIEAQKSNAISVNNEKIDAPRRLRHDDEIVFAALPKFSLVLHEPSSLVALESLLSARNGADGRFGNPGANNPALAAGETFSEKISKKSFLERKYFKHFSFVELVSMIIGTLIGAVLIFLLLELIFS